MSYTLPKLLARAGPVGSARVGSYCVLRAGGACAQVQGCGEMVWEGLQTTGAGPRTPGGRECDLARKGVKGEVE